MAIDAQAVPRCVRCFAPMVNGTFAHAAGCRNRSRVYDEVLQEWCRYLECPVCGTSVLDGNECECTIDSTEHSGAY